MTRSPTIHKKISFLIALFIVTTMISCIQNTRAYHEFIMRGVILEVHNKEIFLCIGSKDGARVGQQFDVYKLVKERFRYQARAITTWNYRKVKTGIVKITEIVDEHFAIAAILYGTATKDSIVELQVPLDYIH